MEDKDQRTEKATPKRLKEARERGDVGKSREVASVAVIFAALGALYFSGSFMLEQMMAVTQKSLFDAGTFRLTTPALHNLFIEVVTKIGIITFPVTLAVLILAALSNVAQVGFLFTTKPLKPKFEKLDPAEGVKRLFSLRSIVELIKSIFKILIVAVAVYLAMRGEIERIPPLIYMSPFDVMTYICGVSFRILLMSSWVLLVLAILDFAYQRWEYGRKLRMTKQEVKDELKQTEGDPRVKARVRSLQKEWAKRRMMEEVPKADVVITNPIHFAVALAYDGKKGSAPVVVAKGRSRLAARIRELAVSSGVPVVEDKPLARALYKALEVGDEIPVNLYEAVAEVLAYLFRLRGKVGALGG